MDARYYERWEDELLIEFGASGLPWEEAPAFMGRSTAAALKARWRRIEPAVMKAKRLGTVYVAKPGERRRPCLSCDQDFDSTGFGHRLCDLCKQTFC